MIATVVYAILTASLVKETRQMRKSQTEPNIQVTANPKEEFVNIITLCVKNIGLGPAYDVSFKLLSESNSDGEKELIQDFSKSKFLETGLRYLGPQQDMETGFTQMHVNSEGKIQARLAIEVNYRSSTNEFYKNTFTLNFEEFRGYGAIGTPNLYAIAKALEKMEQNIGHIVTGFRHLHVDTYSEKDRRTKAEQWELERQELLKQNENQK